MIRSERKLARLCNCKLTVSVQLAQEKTLKLAENASTNLEEVL